MQNAKRGLPDMNLRYTAMIGVGGIGAGTFFALNGDHTLGREESRGGRFLDRKDYCKLHIISHYVKTLLGPGFAVVPVGKVGDDEVGRRLLGEMNEAGIDTSLVDVSPGDPTMFSFCFVYPDGSGGNMTTDDSACSRVDVDYIRQVETVFADYKQKGIALAVPEAPLDAREALLGLGTDYGFFRAASFTSEEIRDARKSGVLGKVDLLAINSDEAAALLAADAPDMPVENIVSEAVRALAENYPDMLVSVTAGSSGSWVWDGSALYHLPALKVDAVSTAGAGDAHFSGILTGLAIGFPLKEAHKLGNLVAALSVTSPHTINKDICWTSLAAFAATMNVRFPDNVKALLEDAK